MALKIKLSPNHIKFLRLLQKSRRDKHGKFCLSCYDKNWTHPCQLFNANPFKLFKYADLSHNIYLSENQFSQNKRSISSLEDLDDIFCDCDCTKDNIPLKQFYQQIPHILKLAQLPQPCIKFSGHGFHLVYVIEQIICRANTKKGKNLIQYWQNTEEYVINKINQACLKIFHKSPVDLSVHDTSRVLRLADTNNVKNHPTRSYWVSIANHIYQLKDFWQGKRKYPKLYSYYRHNFKGHYNNSYRYNHNNHTFKKNTRYRSNKNKRFYYLQPFSQRYHGKALIKKNKQLGNYRMNWLINAFYNQRHQYLQGNRDLYLFILAREANKAYPQNDNRVINLLKYINNQIKPYPLERKGLNKIINEVQGNYANAKIEKYNYTTLFICKLLHIHPTYNKHTRTIKRQNIAKIHQDKKRYQDQQMLNKIRYYKQKGQSISAIARLFKCSRHYLYNVMKRCKGYKRNNIKDTQKKQDKHLSHLSQRVNTVKSPFHSSRTDFNCSNYSVNNGDYVPHLSIFHSGHINSIKQLETRNYKNFQIDSLPAIIKNHNRVSITRSNRVSKYHVANNNLTDEQRLKYDAVRGYQEFGQRKLKKNRLCFKLKKWLKSGTYKRYGFSKKQIRKIIRKYWKIE